MAAHNVNPDDNESRDPLNDRGKIKVLFVCLGNICRSPAAEAIFSDFVVRRDSAERFSIDSAGTGGYHVGDLPDSRMRIHARRRGIELTHICRQVTVEDFESFDLIIGMDASNLYNLRQLAPSVEAARKIHPMAEFFPPGCRFDHVPDPYYEGAEGFERVLDLLTDACERLYDFCCNEF